MGQKFTVGGVLCLEAKNNDIKSGYDIVDVQTRRSVMFGRFASKADFPGTIVGNYLVSYEGLEFAKRAIQKAFENRCDMVFIDEVGHLELGGKGIIESARTACQKASNTTIVVRKQLLTAFFEYFHLTDPEIRFDIKELKLDPSYPLPERRTVA